MKSDIHSDQNNCRFM